jgi:hypothetical protein
VRSIALLVLIPIGLGACSSDGSKHPARVTTTTTAAGVTTSTSTTSTTLPFAGSTKPVSSPATTETTALLRAIRITHTGGVDRVTFEFEGTARPAASIAYVDRPVADGSGETVPVKGSASLRVRFEPAATRDLRGDSPRTVYTGPDRVTGDSRMVTEVVRGGDFEGVLTWFIGVKRTTPFRLAVVPSAPSELTIELAAP